jgi:hypothetical protein
VGLAQSRQTNTKRIALALLGIGVMVGILLSVLPRRSSGALPLTQLKERFAKKSKPSVDHAQFDPAFSRAFLQPAPFVSVGNRWDEDVRRFRQEAQAKIPQLIEAQKASAHKAPKQEKKIQGGC